VVLQPLPTQSSTLNSTFSAIHGWSASGTGSGIVMLGLAMLTTAKSSKLRGDLKNKSSPLRGNGDASVHGPPLLSNTYKKTLLPGNGARHSVRAGAPVAVVVAVL
jgi:hypothetical protein